ncbi:MAG: hypothetical protein CV087_04250 [Candidatus Brocadia sp. WS118]|nr:MAG: hypothetical protein CV087_04250 [Candidatus Brocadia sp. WS118]
MISSYQNKVYLHTIPIGIIVFLTIITYLNCLPNQFVYDDTSTIVDNQLIRHWGNLKGLFNQDYFKYSGELTYRPLVTLSYIFDYSLWHLNPLGYHIVNVVLHAMNVILIYFLLFFIFRYFDTRTGQSVNNPLASPPSSDFQGYNTGKTEITRKALPQAGLASLTSTLFAVHPITTEVVNGISYREDLIATAFLLASFLFFVLCQERVMPQNPPIFLAGGNNPKGFAVPQAFSKGTMFLSVSAFTTYFFALLSKESAIVLPALVFCFIMIFTADAPANGHSSRFFSLGRAALKTMRTPFLLGYLGISILYLTVRFFILHNPGEKIGYPEGSFFINALTMTKVLGRYLTTVFLPFNLNADYHVLYLKPPLPLPFVIPLFVLISIAIIAVRLVKKANAHQVSASCEKKNAQSVNKGCYYRIMLFAILWFFLSLLPVLNIIPLANIMADRYLYLPLIGFCLCISTGFAAFGKTIRYPVIISLLIFYVVITVARNNVWRDEFTLWHTSSQSPLCSFTTYNNLGTQYNKKGDPDTALRCYQKALQKAQEVGFNQYAAVYYNIGNAYEKKNLPYQAVSAYKKAIQMKHDYQQAHNNLGKIYFTLGQYDDAMGEYNTAITINPNFAYVYNNLGVLYHKLGRQEDAIMVYQKAVSLDPQYGDAYYNLGNVYEARKQYDLALEAYKDALKFEPAQAYIHNNLGTIYDKKGLLEDAIAAYKHAIRLNPAYPYSYNNLGATLIKKGDTEGAVVAFQKAVDLLPDQPDFHFNIGYTYFKKGNWESALKKFETTRRLAPAHAEAIFYMGAVYYEQGDKKRAGNAWQAVLYLNPNHAKAKKYLEMLAE